MTALSNIAAGLVLGLVLTSGAPAIAGNHHTAPGHNARAQVIEQSIGGDESISPDRARALRECNLLAEPIKGYNLMISQFAVYRSCMANHGQAE